jgi:hypothetical protein
MDKIPKATHEGILPPLDIPCFVLGSDGGTRLITQRGMQSTIGMSTSGATSGALRLAQFVERLGLKFKENTDLAARLRNPILFIPLHGGRSAYGYEATILIDVCEFLLKARDKRVLTEFQERYAAAADVVIRAFAKVGIIAVVDEVTGYQEIRDREALQQILDKYIRQDWAAAWAKRFPDEFYQEMFRLRGWQWRGMKVNRPSVVAHYTKDLVYQRLAPGILEELEHKNPKDERGSRKHRHHQWLTDDIGIPALAQHLYATVGFMRAASTWDQFYRMMQRAFPKLNSTMWLGFPEITEETEA